MPTIIRFERSHINMVGSDLIMDVQTGNISDSVINIQPIKEESLDSDFDVMPSDNIMMRNDCKKTLLDIFGENLHIDGSEFSEVHVPEVTTTDSDDFDIPITIEIEPPITSEMAHVNKQTYETHCIALETTNDVVDRDENNQILEAIRTDHNYTNARNSSCELNDVNPGVGRDGDEIVLDNLRAEESAMIEGLLQESEDGIMMATFSRKYLENFVNAELKKRDVLMTRSRDGNLFCKCTVCDAEFTNSTRLEAHGATHHSIVQIVGNPFGCLKCNDVFSTSSLFRNHKCAMADRKIVSLKCVFCAKSMAVNLFNDHHCSGQGTSDCLRKHYKNQQKKKTVCDIHPASKRTEDAKGHTESKEHRPNDHHVASNQCQTKQEGSLVCPVCHAQFTSSTALIGHLGIHTKDEEKMCHLCAKVFRSRRDFVRHIYMHSQNKRYECPDCGKLFVTLNSMERHLAIAHATTKAKRVSLREKCSNNYLDEKGLKHRNKSADLFAIEEPNEKTQNDIQTVKCFTCKVVVNVHKFKKHCCVQKAKEEQSRKCPICLKIISTHSNYTRHLRVHTNEKTFTCPVCQRAFNCASNMKRHLDIHTQNKRYACPKCDKKFVQSNDMKKHVLKVHD